jgi:hypothetical protein
MASLREKLEAELEQMDYMLYELPGGRQVNRLYVLELAGTASLLTSLHHGVENIFKQGLHAKSVPLPSEAACKPIWSAVCTTITNAKQPELSIACTAPKEPPQGNLRGAPAAGTSCDPSALNLVTGPDHWFPASGLFHRQLICSTGLWHLDIRDSVFANHRCMPSCK